MLSFRAQREICRRSQEISRCARNDSCCAFCFWKRFNNLCNRKPGGRRAWMHAVFRHGMDAVSKNRDCTANAEFALSRKALFFGSFP